MAATDGRPPALARCPVCACPLQDALDGPVVACERCSTPHHQDCWEWNGGCAVFACREAAPPDRVEVDAWPLVLQDYRTWLDLTRRSRQQSMLFVLACLVAAHVGLLSAFGALGAGWALLVAAAAMGPAALAFARTEGRAAALRQDLEPVAGRDPFAAEVGPREVKRWLDGARDVVGGLGPERGPSRPLAIMLGLLLGVLVAPAVGVLPLRAVVFLALFDAFVLWFARDSFRSMRAEQSILIERFKTSFEPRALETSKKAEAARAEDPGGAPPPEGF